jgi:hypothetical protein
MTKALSACLLFAFVATAGAGGLTLSPAAVPLAGRPGQSTEHRLTLLNTTSLTLAFKLVAKDVVVRDGARVFVPAGDLRDSIAATARFSVRDVVLAPGAQVSVDVRVTLPARVHHRAVVVLFEGTTHIAQSATVSIGSLLTFDLGGPHALAPGEPIVEPPTASANATLAIPVANAGDEPDIVRAAAVIVRGNGTIVGKLAVAPRRLLPGEQAELRADYAGELQSGSYRVIATIEAGRRSWIRASELVVP